MELVEDTSTVPTGREIVKTNSFVSKSKTENIGDAWFKKISEIERKTFTCHNCLSVFEKFGLLVNHQRARHGIVESQVFLDCEETQSA